MLFDIPHRIDTPELMDLGDGTKADFARNFREIEAVNRWLGGTRLSKKGVLSMMKGASVGRITDIGCGSGDVLRGLAADIRFAQFELVGVDHNPMFLGFARAHGPDRIQYFPGDVLLTPNNLEPASLYMFNMMLHHFRQDQVVGILKALYHRCTVGLLINDLCRNYLAFGFIWVVARLAGTSRQFRCDAPLSVRKGFTRQDWIAIMAQCGFTRYEIQWDPGFRHLIKVYKA